MGFGTGKLRSFLYGVILHYPRLTDQISNDNVNSLIRGVSVPQIELINTALQKEGAVHETTHPQNACRVNGTDPARAVGSIRPGPERDRYPLSKLRFEERPDPYRSRRPQS